MNPHATDEGWAVYYEALADGCDLAIRRMEDLVIDDRRMARTATEKQREVLLAEVAWATEHADCCSRRAIDYRKWAKELREGK
jgi:hypothetical protein